MGFKIAARKVLGTGAFQVWTPTASIPAAPTYAQKILADGAVAYWRLGESAGANAVDQLGGNTGTYANCTLGTAGLLTGDADTAVTFNGTSSLITIPSTLPQFVGAALSCDAWLKINDLTKTSQMIFGAYNAATSTSGWGFIFNQGSADHKLGYLNTTVPAWVKSTGTIDDTNRHHVGFSVTAGGAVIFYLDGTAIGSVAGHSPNAFAGTTKAIGAQAGGAGSLFKGVLDEVALYDKVLAPTDFAAHYALGL